MRPRHHPLILAGSALGLLMASTPLSAYPLQVRDLYEALARSANRPVIRVQAECPEGMSAEECAKAQSKKGKSGKNEDQDTAAPPAEMPRQERKQQKQAEPRAQQAAPESKAPSAVEPERKPRKQRQKEEQQPAPIEQAAPEKRAPPAAEAVQKPREQRQKQENQAEPPAGQAAPAAEPEQKFGQQRRREQQAEQEQSAPVPEEKPAETEQASPKADQPADEAAEQKSRKEKLRDFLKKQQKGEEVAPGEGAEPAEKAAPAGQTTARPEPKSAPAKVEQPSDQATEPKSRKEKLRNFLKKQQEDGEAASEQPEQPNAPAGQGKQAGKPKTDGEGKATEQAAPEAGKAEPGQKVGEQSAPGAKQAEGGEQPASEPVLPGNLKAGKPRRQERVKDQAEANPLPENAAPVFDSAKSAVGAAGRGEPAGKVPVEEPQEQQDAAGAAPPLPESDAAAQEVKIAPADIQSLLVEEGKRFEPSTREERREFRRERRERRKQARVVKEYNDNRTIIEINNQIYIDSPDYTRIILDDDDVYYDELPGGRTREVIVRPNGSRVVTVRNRYGDIIRRSRITRDGREIVLVYVPDRSLDLVAEWEDPASNLPPLRLTVPVSSYILEADTVDDPDRYYTFLEQPPIADIERIYSVGEVTRSARLRDIMPRIDLDTINFETGSAEIGESEVDELDAIAQAILRMLEDNPGETFLIEGHTDAVGSKESNLVLSDRRASAVAEALTSVYDIPPENLVTQGYGEQYLKMNTEDASRANRRVALRRITPLVAPVASAQ